MTAHTTDTSASVHRVDEGGVDTPAALLGMFTAMGVLVFLGSLIAAGAGGIEYQLNTFDVEGNAQEVAVVGIVVAFLVVFASFFVGGLAAGRMAHADGGWTGAASALWMILLVAIFAALGAWVGSEYNAFQRAGLPDWFSQFRRDDLEASAAVAGALAVVAARGGGDLGGRVGRRAGHRRTVSSS